MSKLSILFVCLGNICRSPLAEGVFHDVIDARGEASRYRIDSAGTGAWHVGSAPDPRSIEIAARYGIDTSRQAARKFSLRDSEDFDLVLGLDRSNVDDLRAAAGPRGSAKVHLYMDYALGLQRDVPDPYYGCARGFEEVYRMIREASEALAEKLAVDVSAAPSGHTSSTI